MVTIKIYIEGGGDSKELSGRFREAWHKFFKAADLPTMPRIVRGKSRQNTYDLFKTAVSTKEKNTVPLLLLDSEDPVNEAHTAWQHLKARDGWDRPEHTLDNQAYLMVQVMETWLLADAENLRTYFGSNFKADKIPAWQALEAVEKDRIFKALDDATQNCNKKYLKGKISFEVLAKINPKLVAAKCPHAKELFDFLNKPT